MSEYRVVRSKDKWPCGTCGARVAGWDVIDRAGVALSTTTYDREEAELWAALLNDAYLRGSALAEARWRKRVKK